MLYLSGPLSLTARLFLSAGALIRCSPSLLLLLMHADALLVSASVQLSGTWSAPESRVEVVAEAEDVTVEESSMECKSIELRAPHRISVLTSSLTVEEEAVGVSSTGLIAVQGNITVTAGDLRFNSSDFHLDGSLAAPAGSIVFNAGGREVQMGMDSVDGAEGWWNNQSFSLSLLELASMRCGIELRVSTSSDMLVGSLPSSQVTSPPSPPR